MSMAAAANIESNQFIKFKFYTNCIQSGWEDLRITSKKRGFYRSLENCLYGLHALLCWFTRLLSRLLFARSRPWICARSVRYDLPFALIYKSAKHFNIAFLYFYDHLQGGITLKSGIQLHGLSLQSYS